MIMITITITITITIIMVIIVIIISIGWVFFFLPCRYQAKCGPYSLNLASTWCPLYAPTGQW